MSPVTSTNVAINGAEEVAGSAPNLFKMSGSIEPIKVPHNTTPKTEKAIVKALIQCPVTGTFFRHFGIVFHLRAYREFESAKVK